MHTLERLAAHPRIAGLMLVLAADDGHWIGQALIGGKPVLTCIGGDERARTLCSPVCWQ